MVKIKLNLFKVIPGITLMIGGLVTYFVTRKSEVIKKSIKLISGASTITGACILISELENNFKPEDVNEEE